MNVMVTGRRAGDKGRTACKASDGSGKGRTWAQRTWAQRTCAHWLAAGGMAMLLASCAAGTGGGTAGGGIELQNPLAGMSNPFSGAGKAFDPALRGRITNPFGTAPATGAAAPGAVSDPYAGQGVKQPDIPQSGTVTATTKPAATPKADTAAAAPATTNTTGTAPIAGTATAARSHTVAAGETAWSISRKYGLSITDLASANALPAETMTVRTGQKLVIPAGGATVPAATAQVSAPGTGSPTPRPPSASRALPREDTPPAGAKTDRPAAPDLGATRTQASGGKGKLQMPVNGSIVRAYAKGRNEGIDLSAPGGTTVKAAGSGTVAAITRDTDGVPIVVMRHEGQLMTVYAGLDNLSVAKGDKVSAGEAIGKSSKSGVLHFEVRQGFESVDPEGYLR